MLDHVNWTIVTITLCTLFLARELSALHSALTAIYKSVAGIAQVVEDEGRVRELQRRGALPR